MRLTIKVDDITGIPFYTTPGGPNAYELASSVYLTFPYTLQQPVSHLSCTSVYFDTSTDQPVKTAWIQGFLPGLLWLLVESLSLHPTLVHPRYTQEQIIELARKWQDSFRWMACPSRNHDQGFRFQLSFGKD